MVCAEEGMSSAQLRKETRYLSLKSQIVERNWKTSLMTIEVGVRGFVGSSLLKCLAHVGFSLAVTTTLCKTVSLEQPNAPTQFILRQTLQTGTQTESYWAQDICNFVCVCVYYSFHCHVNTWERVYMYVFF